jgi:UDPglucose 6-dehydrogenase
MKFCRGFLAARIAFGEQIYDAAVDADGLAVVTEWHEFREPDWLKIKKAMRAPVIFDGRNIFNPEHLRGLGFTYYAMGRR